jgi:glycosyltransferase involved in cell wall biosynthesis
MISFVWSSKYPFIAGAGGSENYTVGQIRELKRRGIPARVLVLGHDIAASCEDFPDLTIQTLPSKAALSEIDDTLVFVTYPLNVPTLRPSYAILHCPPPGRAPDDPLFDPAGLKGKRLITPSKFATKMWRKYMNSGMMTQVPTVHPFAEPCFAEVQRPQPKSSAQKILFAGRLSPEKGIYTLLAALHMQSLQKRRAEITVTSAGSHSDDGKILLPLLQAHPSITVVPSQRTPEAMATLMAQHDVVVMPSTRIFWQETFGIVSVEAQHAGCRVVASRAGGLPETDCGGLILTEPDNPKALAASINRALVLGPLTAAERNRAKAKFTVQKSVDALLDVIQADAQDPKKKPLLHTEVTLFPALPRLQPQIASIGRRLTQSPPLTQRSAGR